MDLVIIADSTSSMVEVQKSLKATFHQAFNLAALTGCFARIGLLLYTDYTNITKYPVTSWSGWCDSFSELAVFVESSLLHPGGDEPEACKTALNLLLDLVSRKTIVLWYGDAAPHHVSNNTHPNYAREQKALQMRTFDWIVLSQRAASQGCVILPIINTLDTAVTSFFLLLSTVTGGITHCIPQACEANDITRETIRILLTALGSAHSAHSAHQQDVPQLVIAQRLGYKKPLPVLVNRTENQVQGYLPTSIPGKKSIIPAIQVVNVTAAGDVQETTDPELRISMQKLKHQFAKDEEYADTVFRVFVEISADAAQVTSLTYNNIFAGLWRTAVSRHADPRRDRILQQLVKTLPSMKQAERQQVQKWLEASYDASEEITEAIARLPSVQHYPALVIQGATTPIRPQYLTGLAKSCQRKDLKRVIDLLAKVQVLKASPNAGNDTVRMLPLALPAQELISMLPHLMCKGLIFARRSSAILAILAVLSRNTLLRGPAHDYLQQVRGKWYDADNVVNYSVPFVRLAMKASSIFTDKEVAHLSIVRDLQGLIMNRATDVDVKVPRGLSGVEMLDYKRRCTRCHQLRSFTLLSETGWCGHCCSGFVDNAPVPVPASAIDRVDKSVMFDCICCFARYAIIDTQDLKVPPRCHYCRIHHRKGLAPVSTCHRCNIRFVDPVEGCKDGDNMSSTGPFTCAPCQSGSAIQSTTEQFETTVETLFHNPDNRPAIFAALNLQGYPQSYNVLAPQHSRNVFSLRNTFTRTAQKDETATTAADIHRSLTFQQKNVLNAEEVLASIRDWAQKHVAELGMCMLCCDELPKNALVTACGRRGCTVRCCAPCIETWYSYIRPGHILPLANLLCPFCKRAPAPEILFRSNREACELVRSRPTNGYDPAYYYGWCVSCNRGKQWMEKVCAQEGPPSDGNFRCEGCSYLVTAATINARDCPGCGVTCEKTHGCDHITCRCGCHWCWRCGKAVSQYEIYRHLPSCHGDEIYQGFTGAATEVFDDEDEDEDDDY